MNDSNSPDNLSPDEYLAYLNNKSNSPQSPDINNPTASDATYWNSNDESPAPPPPAPGFSNPQTYSPAPMAPNSWNTQEANQNGKTENIALGIISIVLSLICLAPFGLIAGIVAVRKTTGVGKVLGWIGTVFGLIGTLAFLAFITFVIIVGKHGGYCSNNGTSYWKDQNPVQYENCMNQNRSSNFDNDGFDSGDFDNFGR